MKHGRGIQSDIVRLDLYARSFLNAPHASKYANAPNQRTVLNPNVTASIMVITGARTEKNEFVAHAHGIRDEDLRPINFIPNGKGIPIRRPAGMILRDTMNALMIIGYCTM